MPALRHAPIMDSPQVRKNRKPNSGRLHEVSNAVIEAHLSSYPVRQPHPLHVDLEQAYVVSW